MAFRDLKKTILEDLQKSLEMGGNEIVIEEADDIEKHGFYDIRHGRGRYIGLLDISPQEILFHLWYNKYWPHFKTVLENYATAENVTPCNGGEGAVLHFRYK